MDILHLEIEKKKRGGGNKKDIYAIKIKNTNGIPIRKIIVLLKAKLNIFFQKDGQKQIIKVRLIKILSSTLIIC